LIPVLKGNNCLKLPIYKVATTKGAAVKERMTNNS